MVLRQSNKPNPCGLQSESQVNRQATAQDSPGRPVCDLCPTHRGAPPRLPLPCWLDIGIIFMFESITRIPGRFRKWNSRGWWTAQQIPANILRQTRPLSVYLKPGSACRVFRLSLRSVMSRSSGTTVGRPVVTQRETRRTPLPFCCSMQPALYDFLDKTERRE
ncbi:hypothetical protein VTG60DRAFT_4440 [Thermothelomyces hinnuleus]